MMKSVIMAGGEGTRLRPLTCDIPKPMARLCGRPAIEYILELLARHGVHFAWVTVRYLPGALTRHFPENAFGGVALDFVEEDAPLGTAGSVKNACGDCKEDILVISGDALCDFDLTAAMAFHKKHGAAATLIVKAVADPREYGLVCADSEGRITGFVEKPSYYQAVSELANTGIYILSPEATALIPQGVNFDFAKDLFPLMMEKQMKLMAYADEGYWCDIGDLNSYLRCQIDMLEGRVDCRLAGEKDAEGNVFKSGRPVGHYTIQPPVYVGEGVRIGDFSLVESGSILDNRVVVGRSTRVSGSLLLADSSVGDNGTLTGAILCAGSVAGDKVMLFEGSVAGAGARMGKGSSLAPGVKIWPGKIVSAGVRATGHIKNANGGKEGYFDDSGIVGGDGLELTPELCARIGSALGSMAAGERVGLATADVPFARVMADALASGIQASGSGVLDFGAGTRPFYHFAMGFCSLRHGIYVGSSGAGLCAQLTGVGGLPATRSSERELEGILERGEYNRTPKYNCGDRMAMGGIKALYQSHILCEAPLGLSGVGCTIKSGHRETERAGLTLLQKLGADIFSGFTLWIDATGARVALFDRAVGYIPYPRLLAACCTAEFAAGHDVALTFEAPRAIDEAAAQYGRKVLRYYSCPADASDQKARDLALTQLWTRDGLMLAIRFLRIVKECEGNLPAALEGVPSFYTSERGLGVAGNPARLIRQFEPENAEGVAGEGVVIRREEGTIFIRPGKAGRTIRVFAEAASSEIADELCSDMIDRIKKANSEHLPF